MRYCPPIYVLCVSSHLWTVPRQIKFWSISIKSWEWARPPPPRWDKIASLAENFIWRLPLQDYQMGLGKGCIFCTKEEFFPLSWWVRGGGSVRRHMVMVMFDDGHFLWRWDGNVFFPRHHCHRWVFNGLTIPGPSTLNVFLQINNWNWWFFYGFPKFRCNSQRWFWPWQRPENAHNHDISPFATTVLII